MYKVGAYKRAVALSTKLRMNKTADGNEWWDGIVDYVTKNKYKLLAGAGGALAGSLIGKNIGGRQGALLGALGGGALGYGAGHAFNWDEIEPAQPKPLKKEAPKTTSDTASVSPTSTYQDRLAQQIGANAEKSQFGVDAVNAGTAKVKDAENAYAEAVDMTDDQIIDAAEVLLGQKIKRVPIYMPGDTMQNVADLLDTKMRSHTFSASQFTAASDLLDSLESRGIHPRVGQTYY